MPSVLSASTVDDMAWIMRPGRWLTGQAYVVDTLVALALFGLLVSELLTGREPGAEPTNLLAFVSAAAMSLPYAAHRLRPAAALAVTCAAVVVYSLGHFTGYPGYVLFVMVFGLALHGHSGDALFSSRSFLYFLTSLVTLSLALALQPAELVDLSAWVSSLLVLAVAWLAGENLRARRDRWAELEERARRLEAEREERARQAVDAERMRIARELHDVVAHSMSLIAVQAGVANHVIDTRPSVAREALGAIETTSRSALVEMRRMLGVLRQPDEKEESAALQPCYCLNDLEAVVRQMSVSGLQVEMTLGGDPDAVPQAVSLSAYRIAQEALTNVLKHGGSSAQLDIRCGDDAVVVEVRDPGADGVNRERVDGSGHGLIGMRERVAVFGGRLQAGPDGRGGFRVAARLPYAEEGASVSGAVSGASR
jgi:signal transduction histidine kinase